MKQYKYIKQSTGQLNEPEKSWGGQWTNQKLDAFEKYVNAYLTIMNVYRYKYNWKLIYFDGFAGSGSRQEVVEDDSMGQTLFGKDINQEDTQVYRGAAERVLSISQTGFDYYYFIDIDAKANEELEKRLNGSKNYNKCVFRNGDANDQVRRLCQAMKDNSNLRALVLLDPFGMDVNWQSLELFKGLSVDLWILIPTGVIVNRLLDKKCKLKHIDKLKSFFGMEEAEIKDRFYKIDSPFEVLFEDQVHVKKIEKPILEISKLYVEKLKGMFKSVVDEPLVLYNSKSCPIYHFAFASNNETARRIAKDIIGKS
jgi:hypothetical protein